MPPIILLRPIGHNKFRIKGIKTLIMKELKDEAHLQKLILAEPTKTWRGAKPRFVSIVIATQDQIGAHTYADQNSEGGKKFMWLDEGTKTRWALMSGNWSSKTRVGSFRAGAGAGRPVIVGRKAMLKRKMKARPGIKARRWTEMARKNRLTPFRNRMVAMFKVYAAGWRH